MRIALLGDMALLGRYDREKTNDVDRRLEAVGKITKSCDFAVANLEALMTERTKTHACKGVYLRTPTRSIETLKNLGITHVTLANNHIFDYGEKAAAETISILKRNGIGYVGLNGEPALLQCGQDRAILDGFCCYSANGLRYGAKPGMLKLLSKETVLDFFAQAEKAKALPIVSAHFGLEGVHYPAMEHRNFFKELSKTTDFVLHGNHPHAIQGIELANASLLIYAQGNLCFDTVESTSIKGAVLKDSERGRECFAAVIEVEENRLKNYTLHGFSDFEDGYQRRSLQAEQAVQIYSQAFSLPAKEYMTIRKNARKDLSSAGKKRDVHFFLQRLNYKYIVAYFNGMIHAKKYRRIFSDYFEEETTP